MSGSEWGREVNGSEKIVGERVNGWINRGRSKKIESGRRLTNFFRGG
jgi:hypothetical protein